MQEYKVTYFFFLLKVRLKRANHECLQTLPWDWNGKNSAMLRREVPWHCQREICGHDVVGCCFHHGLFFRNYLLKSIIFKHERGVNQTESFRERNSEDMILIHPWLSRSITKDLILLEDQIPFFVLEKLYDDVVPDYMKMEKQTAGFVDLAIKYFAFYNTQMFYSIKYKKQFFSGSHRSSSKSTKHFTDLIRFDYLPVGIAVKSGYARHVLRTATKLRDSGVSFEKGDVRRSLLDI